MMRRELLMRQLQPKELLARRSELHLLLELMRQCKLIGRQQISAHDPLSQCRDEALNLFALSRHGHSSFKIALDGEPSLLGEVHGELPVARKHLNDPSALLLGRGQGAESILEAALTSHHSSGSFDV